MSEKVDLLIHGANALLHDQPVLDGAEDVVALETVIAVDEGKIVAVGAGDELLGKFEGRETIDAAGRLMTPGFVDSHTHLVFAGDRSGEFAQRCQGASYEEIAAAGGGIRASVRATPSS